MNLELRLNAIDERLRRLEAHVGLVAIPAPSGVPARAVDPTPVPVPVPAASAATAAARTHAAAPTLPASPPPPAPTSAPTPPAAPARPRRAPALVRAGAAKAPRDLERFVGVAVLGRIGIAAVLLAAVYFGQLGWREITPAAKVGVVYALAGALVGVGAAVRRKASRLYVAMLFGGGTAAMYLAGVLARLAFHIVGPLEGLVMLAAACATGQFLAHRARMQVLAIVALGGAFAAPLLVGSPTDARTSLLVYLLALHAWAAFAERSFGWKGARVVGVLGTTIVALAWLVAHGGVDASTYVHLHAYFFGLTAPEWGRAILGRELAAGRARVVLVFALLFEGLVFLPIFVAGALGARFEAVPVASDVIPAIALVWTALAVLARRRTNAPIATSRVPAHLAALLLVPAVCFVGYGRGLEEPALATLALVLLAALSIGLRVARARFGLSAAAPLCAALVALGIVAAHGIASDVPPQALHLLLGLVPALVLTVTRGFAVVRTAGLLVGLAAIATGLPVAYDARGVASIFAAGSAWVLLARASGRVALSAVLVGVIDVVLALATVAWIVPALSSGVFVRVDRAVVNWGSAAALALAATIAAVGPWRRRRPQGLDTGVVLVAAWVGLLGCAAWREVHAALSAHATTSTQAGLETFFFCAAALGSTLVGRRLGAPGFALLSTGVFALGFARASAALYAPGEGAWIAAELAGLAVSAWAIGALERTGRAAARVVSTIALLSVGLLFLNAMSMHRLGGGPLVFNARFAAGLALALVFACTRFEARRGLPAAAVVLLGVASSAAGFLAGHLEVRDAVASAASSSWRDAAASLHAALFAAGLLTLGFVRRAADLRWCALAGFGLVVVKVAIHDLASVSTPIRILISGGFGVILLVAAYAYARAKQGERPGLPAAPQDGA